MKAVAIDFETILCPETLCLIPGKTPRQKKEPMDKAGTDTNLIKPCVFGWCGEVGASTYGIDMRTDKALIQAVWDILADYNLIVTFNGNGFDIPLLYKRSWLLGITPSKRIDLRRYVVPPQSNHADLRAILSNWDQYAPGKLPFYAKLKFGKDMGDIDGSKVGELWNAGEFQAVHEHCLSDVRMTWDLFQSMRGYYFDV